MARPTAPFPDRLALARALVAHGAPAPSVHEADQCRAAGKDAARLHERLGALASALQPARSWFHRREHGVEDETRAYLVAAVLDCMPDTCCHLRRGGPQPALVLLPLRRIACMRCAATRRRPVTAPDECDVCGARDIVTFVPFSCHQGPAIIGGDCCEACADVLGIRAGKEITA